MATRTHHLQVSSPEASGRAGDSNYEAQLQAAQSQLEKLHKKQEEIQRKRLEEEELNLSRSQFIEGQIELSSKLDGSVQAIDREIFDLRQEVTNLEEARKTFASNLQKLQGIDPGKFRKTKLAEDLEQAHELLANCEGDFEEISAQIGEGHRRGFIKPSAKAGTDTFSRNFSQGFAFNLPIIILGTIALLIWLSR